MAAPKVFVSYSRKDREITQRLVADLHQAGAEVWVDVDGIQSGNFMQAIDKALAACDWMVLVLSPSALESQYVPEETYTALHRVKQGYMKGVIPVLVAPCTPGSIPPQWDVLQRYDAMQGYDSARDGVLKAIGLAPLKKIPPAWSVEEQGSLGQQAKLEQANQMIRQIADQQSQDPKSVPIPPDRFPKRLADLGFTTHSDNGVEYILPPLCTVPAGEFLMGSDPERDKIAGHDEQPQHIVVLPTFEIARFPVTVAEYACFVHVGHQAPTDWQRQLSKLAHPVVNVAWQDASDYAYWVSVRTSQSWWRLPTEAEWEKAARGTDGLIYPWGDTFEQAWCNTSDSYIGTTTPVGHYPIGISPYGVQDMAGNIWEWTGTHGLPYPYAPSAVDSDMNARRDRVLRGGSWYRDAKVARSAYRNHHEPSNVNNYSGFRLVRAAPNS